MRPDNSHRLSNQMQTYTVKNIVSGVVTPIVIVATTLRVRITNLWNDLWNAWASVGYSRSNWLIVAWDTGRVLISPTARSRACGAERAHDDAPRAHIVFERVASLNI